MFVFISFALYLFYKTGMAQAWATTLCWGRMAVCHVQAANSNKTSVVMECLMGHMFANSCFTCIQFKRQQAQTTPDSAAFWLVLLKPVVAGLSCALYHSRMCFSSNYLALLNGIWTQADADFGVEHWLLSKLRTRSVSGIWTTAVNEKAKQIEIN